MTTFETFDIAEVLEGGFCGQVAAALVMAAVAFVCLVFRWGIKIP